MEDYQIEYLKEVQNNLKTQNNRCCEYPTFEVQALREKITPEGYEYDGYYLLDKVDHEFEIRDFVLNFGDGKDDIELSEDDLVDMEERGFTMDDMELFYYHNEWETVQTCLTEAGAQAFIDRKAHDYPKLRIYGNSIYYNMEQRMIRELLMNLNLDKLEFLK